MKTLFKSEGSKDALMVKGFDAKSLKWCPRMRGQEKWFEFSHGERVWAPNTRVGRFPRALELREVIGKQVEIFEKRVSCFTKARDPNCLCNNSIWVKQKGGRSRP